MSICVPWAHFTAGDKGSEDALRGKGTPGFSAVVWINQAFVLHSFWVQLDVVKYQPAMWT